MCQYVTHVAAITIRIGAGLGEKLSILDGVPQPVL